MIVSLQGRRNKINQDRAHHEWHYDCAMARRKIAEAGRKLRESGYQCPLSEEFFSNLDDDVILV